MIVIPAVDLRGGRCVRLREGRADAETVFSDDPVAMAERWVAAGAERLHVVDLDGAFAGAPKQTALIAKIVDAVRPVPVEAGGGLRDLAAVEAVLEAGARWAVVGTRYARLSSFAFGPRAVADYLRSLLTLRPKHYLGHNPAGSWVIYLLVLLGITAGATGYATYNDIGGDWMEDLHEGAANAMLTLVFVHVAGVVVSSLLHRENLVKAMVTGYKLRHDEHSG